MFDLLWVACKGHFRLNQRDDRDDEIARLKSKMGEITIDNELLYAPHISLTLSVMIAPSCDTIHRAHRLNFLKYIAASCSFSNSTISRGRGIFLGLDLHDPRLDLLEGHVLGVLQSRQDVVDRIRHHFFVAHVTLSGSPRPSP